MLNKPNATDIEKYINALDCCIKGLDLSKCELKEYVAKRSPDIYPDVYHAKENIKEVKELLQLILKHKGEFDFKFLMP